MIGRRGTMALLLAGLMGLTGCAGTPNTSSTESTVPSATKTQEEPVKVELTWQDAKAHTQALELEIAAQVPEDAVISIDQKTKGMLLSCNRTKHSWNGSTTVTVTEGTKIEPILKEIKTHYQSAQYVVEDRLDIRGSYEVQISPHNTSDENYIVAEGLAPNQIRIDSGSECFTLPEGIYPGGDF